LARGGAGVIKVSIDIPDWVVWVFVQPLLFFRRVRYGYSFRRIGLSRGEYAIVDVKDYGWLSKYKWFAQEGQRTLYACRRERVSRGGKQRAVAMHREIMGAVKGELIDHINHDGRDNRRVNLRKATRAENAQNRRKPRVKSKSKYKGLSWQKRTGKWSVRIQVDWEHKCIGTFTDELEAAKAYDKAAKKHHGEFASLNFPDGR
jgi:hypothetical protein